MLLYALTILVSAFLLFQVAAGDRQDHPAVVRRLGGGLDHLPALLPDGAAARVPVRPRRRPLPPAARADAAALRACCWSAPRPCPSIRASPGSPPGGEDPTLGILRLLAVTVGLPYFLLSTTGPLLQAWYARSFKGAMPYRLYALSNAGSMFALISYPFLFEPVFTTHEQSGMWSIAYAVFIALCGFTAFRAGSAFAVTVRRRKKRRRKSPASASMPCGWPCRPAPRCCCWPSPIT